MMRAYCDLLICRLLLSHETLRIKQNKPNGMDQAEDCYLQLSFQWFLLRRQNVFVLAHKSKDTCFLLELSFSSFLCNFFCTKWMRREINEKWKRQICTYTYDIIWSTLWSNVQVVLFSATACFSIMVVAGALQELCGWMSISVASVMSYLAATDFVLV